MLSEMTQVTYGTSSRYNHSFRRSEPGHHHEQEPYRLQVRAVKVIK